jgi:hypothetical protein
MSQNRHNWSQMSLDEFLGFYRGTIYPEMLQDDLDPTETTPTYEWLTEQGYLNQGESPAVHGGRESDTPRHKPRSTLIQGYPL